MNNPEKIFSNIRESGDNWEAREQKMIERLDREVGMIRELKNVVEGVNIEDSNGKIVEKLNDLREKIRYQFQAKTLEHLDRVLAISRELDKKSQEYQDEYKKRERMGEYELEIDPETEKYCENLRKEIRDLLDDEDVYFLYNVEEIILDLSTKHQQVKEYREQEQNGDRTKIILDLKRARDDLDDTDLENLKIKSIVFKPFSVNLIVEPESFEEITESKTTAGSHTRDTAINLIKYTQEQIEMEDTIRHENGHSLLDGSMHLSSFIPSAPFEWIFDAEKLGPFFVERAKVRLFSLSAPGLLDQLHQELLVDLGSDELQDFYIFTGFSALEPIKIKKIYKLLGTMSTAGHETWRIMETLSKQAESSSDEKIRIFCKNLHNRFLSLFVKAMAQYGLSRDISFEISAGAEEDVEILTHLLKPSQFHHILKYLKHKYGDNKIDEITKELKSMVDFKKDIRNTKGMDVSEKRLLELIFGGEE